MKNLIRRILKEEVENKLTYVVFVAGTDKTGVPHATQYSAFFDGLGSIPSDSLVKVFNYDEHKHSNSKLFQFLKENSLKVKALVLFSAACSLGNELSPTYVPKQITYCIEPYACEGCNSKWSNLDYNNFYVNCCAWGRGEGAMEEIPKENKNNFTGKNGHVKALTDAVSKIF